MTPERKKLLMTHIIDVEGGFVNDPDDAGGATKYGITIKTLSDWRGRECTLQDVKDLTIEETVEIYIKKYYNAFNGDKIDSDFKVLCMFDKSVHSGVEAAVMVAQKIVNVAIDGDCGFKTQTAINACRDSIFIREYLQALQAGYFEIVDRRPQNQKFLKGWVITRIHKLWDKVTI